MPNMCTAKLWRSKKLQELGVFIWKKEVLIPCIKLELWVYVEYLSLLCFVILLLAE